MSCLFYFKWKIYINFFFFFKYHLLAHFSFSPIVHCTLAWWTSLSSYPQRRESSVFWTVNSSDRWEAGVCQPEQTMTFHLSYMVVIIFAVFFSLFFFRFNSTVHLKGFLMSFLWLPGRHCEAIKSTLGLIAFPIVYSGAGMTYLYHFLILALFFLILSIHLWMCISGCNRGITKLV